MNVVETEGLTLPHLKLNRKKINAGLRLISEIEAESGKAIRSLNASDNAIYGMVYGSLYYFIRIGKLEYGLEYIFYRFMLTLNRFERITLINEKRKKGWEAKKEKQSKS